MNIIGRKLWKIKLIRTTKVKKDGENSREAVLIASNLRYIFVS